MLGSAESEQSKLTDRGIILEELKHCDHDTWTSRTDRQMDRSQTDDLLW